MTADIVRALFEYQIREDRRLWDEAILPLAESSFKVDTGYSWETLQRECVHVVDAMHSSLECIHGIKSTTVAVTIDDPTRPQVREIWDKVEAEWKSYIAQLDDREFQREVDIVYRDTAMTVPVWQKIFHVFNHNTLHRAEMRQMVAFLGDSVDFGMSFSDHCLTRSL